ncbi:GNAT family N-acetyltransferase [Dactylosporangium sp. NPDC048998]|uniref:GNAT family N-acetyltransferase n=1 Tax=Dactylosporangium sp. NPDC048998 TaxID=3363976 RepID=UPI0037247417
MRIGELSARTGTPARLLRYYEEQGLLTPARLDNGYRDYGEHLVDRVQQIRGLLEAGLPTRLIKNVLPCLDNPCSITISGAGPEVVELLRHERDRMDSRIACLSRNRDAIDAYLSKVTSSVSQPSIRVATPADRDAAVATFVAAFAADPAVRWFLPDDETYPAEAAAMAGHLFDLRVGHGTVWIADGGAAVAMWDPPRSPAGDRAGHPPPPGPGRSPRSLDEPDWAPPGLGRSARSLDEPDRAQDGRFGRYQAVVHRRMPRFPHWYLGVLASHPDHRGRRLGRTVMAAGLARAAADGLPAYLETSNPRNVDVYRSAGFEVAEHLTVDDLPVWIMTTGEGRS